MNALIAFYARIVAAMLGIRVTSWYRTPEHNAEIGGVSNSFHLQGLALDFGSETTEETISLFESLTGWQIVDERGYVSSHWHVEYDGPKKYIAVLGAILFLIILILFLFRKGK